MVPCSVREVALSERGDMKCQAGKAIFYVFKNVIICSFKHLKKIENKLGIEQVPGVPIIWEAEAGRSLELMR